MARGGRPVRGTRPHRQPHASERGMPAAHGAFHAQRALQDTTGPQETGVRGPEGGVRHGVPGIRPGEGGVRRRRDGGREAEGRGEPPARGDRRDGHVPAAGVPGWAPQTHLRKQHDRTAEPGDPPAHARGRRLPRRQQRPDARLRAHQVCHGERMVDPPLSGHVPAL